MMVPLFSRGVYPRGATAWQAEEAARPPKRARARRTARGLPRPDRARRASRHAPRRRLAHEALDAAVADADRWPADLTEDEVLDRLLELNRNGYQHGPVSANAT